MIMFNRYTIVTLLCALIITIGGASPAFAVCVNPAGDPGDVMMNTTFNVPVYCDDTNWIAMTGGDPNAGIYTPNGVNFNGGVDIYEVLGSSGVTDGTTATGSFWFKSSDVSSGAFFYSYASPTPRFYVGFTTDYTLRIRGYNSAGSEILLMRTDTGAINYSDNQWHHVMFSFDSSDVAQNSFHLYIDGVDRLNFASSNDAEIIDFLPAGSEFGGFYNYIGDAADFWIDYNTYVDLSVAANREKFYNNGPVGLGSDGSLPTGTAPDFFLTGDAATWNTNSGMAGGLAFYAGSLTNATTDPSGSSANATQIVPDGLVGHWRFDETSGSTIYDSSGNDNNADTTNVDMSTDTEMGVLNRALNQNTGKSPIVYLTGSALTDIYSLTDITLSAWIKLDSVGAASNYIFDSNNNFNLRLRSSGQLQLGVDGWDGNNGSWISNYAVPAEEWVHVAITYSWNDPVGTPGKFYINGIEDSISGTPSIPAGNYAAPTPDNIEIGSRASASGGELTGLMDDVRLYNRVLDAAEITKIYKARDGIRYNTSQNTMEYFDGNQYVSMTPEWGEIEINEVEAESPILSCPNIGDTCADGTIYAGLSSDGNVPMYTTPADAPSLMSWNDGSTNWVDTAIGNCDGPSNCFKGEYNTDTLVALSGSPAPYMAASYCANLSMGGHDDWYLPSVSELDTLYDNRAAGALAGTFDTSTGYPDSLYWGANENSNQQGVTKFFNIDNHGYIDKNGTLSVRCVRKVGGGARGLIGHWKLDETDGTTAYDSSGNSYTGTMNGSMDAADDSAPGTIGTALSFDGVDDYISTAVTLNNTLAGTDQGTIAGWFKATDTGGVYRIASIPASAAGGNEGFAIIINTDRIQGWAGTGTGDGYTEYAFTDTTSWHHIANTYDGTTLRLYLDGAEVATAPKTGMFAASNDPMEIGRFSSTWNQEFFGEIDDIRLYDRPLSATEVTTLYNMGAPVGSSTALPLGCPNIGDVCDDGTIYAGLSPDGSVEMFTTPENAPSTAWNSGNSSNFGTTGATSNDSGADNTSNIVITDSDTGTSGFQQHPPAQYCYDLVQGGADDWYLPSINELLVIEPNYQAIGGFSSEWVWSSTESSASEALARRFPFAFTNPQVKFALTYQVRCVRKGPAPRCANPYGLEGMIMYNTTHNVMQYCDGARWIAIGKVQ